MESARRWDVAEAATAAVETLIRGGLQPGGFQPAARQPHCGIESYVWKLTFCIFFLRKRGVGEQEFRTECSLIGNCISFKPKLFCGFETFTKIFLVLRRLKA